MRMPRLVVVMSLLLLTAACGLKSDPRGADQVRPKVITDLVSQPAADGVHLTWRRPATYLNGQRMDDLGGFLVFRGVPEQQADQQAEQIADIPVIDRERFRPEKKFEYVDKQVTKGERYYYRVVTYTLDKYYSQPSNMVAVTIEP